MEMPGVVRNSSSVESLTKLYPDFSHEQSRFRAYRWGEDGIAGVTDTHGRINIAFSFWNEEE
jgi:hypothetical protein